MAVAPWTDPSRVALVPIGDRDVNDLTVDDSGARFCWSTSTNVINCIDSATGAAVGPASLLVGSEITHSSPALARVALSGDGKLMLTGRQDRGTELWSIGRSGVDEDVSARLGPFEAFLGWRAIESPIPMCTPSRMDRSLRRSTTSSPPRTSSGSAARSPDET